MLEEHRLISKDKVIGIRVELEIFQAEPHAEWGTDTILKEHATSDSRLAKQVTNRTFYTTNTPTQCNTELSDHLHGSRKHFISEYEIFS